MVLRNILYQELNSLFQPEMFKDYAPNGLQVQGREEVRCLVTGVTASEALIKEAIRREADAIFVHHGYFWQGEDPCLVGMKYHRVKLLIEHGISLFAYHLPLDAHPELGNNAQLGKKLGFVTETGLEPDNPRSIGLAGSLDQPVSGEELGGRIARVLQRKPLHIAGTDRKISKVAWCTGGAQGYIDRAVSLGVDAYITGEASEQTVHIARESDIHFFAAGHHATERYGPMATGARLAEKYDLNHEFIDVANPV